MGSHSPLYNCWLRANKTSGCWHDTVQVFLQPKRLREIRSPNRASERHSIECGDRSVSYVVYVMCSCWFPVKLNKLEIFIGLICLLRTHIFRRRFTSCINNWWHWWEEGGGETEGDSGGENSGRWRVNQLYLRFRSVVVHFNTNSLDFLQSVCMWCALPPFLFLLFYVTVCRCRIL